MKVHKQFDANGTEGCLLIYPDFSTAEPDGERIVGGKMRKVVKCKDTIVVFRIYEREENGHVKKDEKGHAIFKDYKIRHHDLNIRLLDGCFYETDEGNFLDYPGMRCYDDTPK